MSKPPLILISPSIEASGIEFKDRSISLSEAYTRAIVNAGGTPLHHAQRRIPPVGRRLRPPL